ncbi:hypothetical protein DBY65_008555 [Pseudomonas sp. RIT412]|nr:hypothetical protein DBP26_019415 [Pseudomonas sp. RIT 409]RAU54370.1 hypothetical protein DBY65_008555 [Pseudomonas sp. RIT 412]
MVGENARGASLDKADRQKQQSPHEAGFVEVLGGTQSIEPARQFTDFIGFYQMTFSQGYIQGYTVLFAGRILMLRRTVRKCKFYTPTNGIGAAD